jgi:hypothetical protein
MSLRTKIGTAGLGALVLAGTMGGLAAPASADTLPHTFSLSGSTYITDDETFADEHCTRTLSGSDGAQRPFDPGFNISDTNNRCGGEIRVEFHVAGTYQEDGSWCVDSGRVLLYEGVSEGTNDLDGTQSFSGCVPAGTTTLSRSGTVRNTAEGGDKASWNLTVSLY